MGCRESLQTAGIFRQPVCNRMRLCLLEWAEGCTHIDSPSGGLHSHIDEALSAAPSDMEGHRPAHGGAIRRARREAAARLLKTQAAGVRSAKSRRLGTAIQHSIIGAKVAVATRLQ